MSQQPQSIINAETMKLVAEASARAAATEIARSLKHDLKEEFSRVEENLRQKIHHEFELHFGEMKPDEHLVEHSQIRTFLEWINSAKKSFWKVLIGEVVKWVFTLIIVSWLFYSTFFNKGP
jgi:hypothetical protein